MIVGYALFKSCNISFANETWCSWVISSLSFLNIHRLGSVFKYRSEFFFLLISSSSSLPICLITFGFQFFVFISGCKNETQEFAVRGRNDLKRACKNEKALEDWNIKTWQTNPAENHSPLQTQIALISRIRRPKEPRRKAASKTSLGPRRDPDPFRNWP